MPTYDMRCKKCQLIFEHSAGMNDEAKVICPNPECGAEEVEKLMSKPFVIWNAGQTTREWTND